MKRVFSSLNLVEIHHARNLLEAEGVRAFVRNELLSGAVGELPFTECQAELWIADASDAVRAERVLREGMVRDAGKGRCVEMRVRGDAGSPVQPVLALRAEPVTVVPRPP